MEARPKHGLTSVVFCLSFRLSKDSMSAFELLHRELEVTTRSDLYHERYNSLGSPRPVNELRRVSAGMFDVIAIIEVVKRPGKSFANKFSINTYTVVFDYILEPKWLKLTTGDWIRRILDEATNEYTDDSADD